MNSSSLQAGNKSVLKAAKDKRAGPMIEVARNTGVTEINRKNVDCLWEIIPWVLNDVERNIEVECGRALLKEPRVSDIKARRPACQSRLAQQTDIRTDPRRFSRGDYKRGIKS